MNEKRIKEGRRWFLKLVVRKEAFKKDKRKRGFSFADVARFIPLGGFSDNWDYVNKHYLIFTLKGKLKTICL